MWWNSSKGAAFLENMGSIGRMDRSSEVSFQRISLLAWRGWTKACPRCGGRGLFRRWFTLLPTCPHCGLTFEREEGYWTGAMGANIIMTELMFVGLLLLAFIFTWPDPPVASLIVGSVAFTISFPLIFYPFSKTLWMAFDRAFHPPDERVND
ncbi:MAG: DUF983 domain-containing protein [Thermomicrobiaceae bacterium]